MKVKEESEKAGLKLHIQKTKIMASGPITSWQIDGETMETGRDFIFGGSKITAEGDCSHEMKTLTPWKKSYDQLRQHIKKQRHYFANKGPSSQSYGFSSSHVWMWELDYKECWALKKWYFWTVVLEKTLESPLDCKEIKPVNLKGNQSWIFIGRTDAEAETPMLWPPDAKNWLNWKDPDPGKDWQWEKGTIEDEMVGWHHRLNVHEFEYSPGVGDGQGVLECCNPGLCKEWDTAEQLNWIELNWWHLWVEKLDRIVDSFWKCLYRINTIVISVPVAFVVETDRLRELVMDREAWHAAAHGVAKGRTRLRNWTELNWAPPLAWLICCCYCCCLVTLDMSDFVQPYGLQPPRLLYLWYSLGKSTRVDCHAFLHGISPNQGLNLGFLHCT